MAQSTIDTLIQVTGMFLTFIGALVAVGSGLLTWFLNEKSKRTDEEYKRKEERYIELIKSLKGFYIPSASKELKEDFLIQLNLCWLYCPDDVILKAYRFLHMVQTGVDQEFSDADKEKAVGEFILAIRKDLSNRKPVRKTALRAEDFKHLRAT
ncbi:MAG: hypothetical protein HYZ49_00060 [Chloroflexi bacterium]|nr:hypothetical protein [Chloroflexota bacterium]